MNYVIHILLWFLSTTLQSLASKENLYVVGIFETWDYLIPFSKNLLRNETGIQYLASFLMAVRDINNKSDGIADDLLPNHVINPIVSYSIDSSYYDTLCGVAGVFKSIPIDWANYIVGPNGENAMKYSSQFFVQYSVPQIGFDIGGTDFSERASYPYFSRVCATDDEQGKWLAIFVGLTNNWKRVIVFSSSDSYGVNMNTIFSALVTGYGTTVLAAIDFAPGTVSFWPYLESAQTYGAYIFIIIADARDTGVLLEQGYKFGLFAAGIQVLVTSHAITLNMWDYMTKTADVMSIMKGVIGLKPIFSYQSSARAKQFVKRFRALPSTQTVLPSGKIICHNDTDYAGNSLYRVNDLCLGLNFSHFADDGSDLDMYTAYVYDAVLLGAYALQYYYNHTDMYVGQSYASAFTNTIANVIGFTGVTGYVNITNGVNLNGDVVGQGDRVSDNSFYFMNFNAAQYTSTSGAEGFLPIMKVMDFSHSDSGGYVAPCPECVSVIYSTADNSLPLDATPVHKIVLTNAMVGSLIALASVGLLVLALSTAMVVLYRKNRIIRTAQPSLLYVILIGGYLGCASTALAIKQPPSTLICVAQSWLGHMSFGLVFSALISKTFMVVKIFSSGLKRVKTSVARALFDVGVLMAVQIGFLLMNTFVGHPHRTIDNTGDVHNPLQYIYCENTVPVISRLLLILEAIAVLVGLRLTFAARNIPDALNESKFIQTGAILTETALFYYLLLCCSHFPLSVDFQFLRMRSPILHRHKCLTRLVTRNPYFHSHVDAPHSPP